MLKALLLQDRRKQGNLMSPILFAVVLEIVVTVGRLKKKAIEIRQEKGKANFPSANEMNTC